MKCVFRTDASTEIGTGHVMRCLTLADALRQQGADCTFISRHSTDALCNLIGSKGHQLISLPASGNTQSVASDEPAHAAWLGTDWASDAAQTRQAMGTSQVDWLIVDHYALDSRWEQAMRSTCTRLMVIDDLADRPHDCDLLLDQNLGRQKSDYDGLLPASTIALIGPEFALLRPEFARLRDASITRRPRPTLRHLLITMGGSDKDNFTGKILDAVKACIFPSYFRITVVMGPNAPWLAQVQKLALHMPCPTQVLIGISDMASHMVQNDLAIGAAGGTSWERCCLGLPALVLVSAPNQHAGAMALEQTGATITLASSLSVRHTLMQLLAEDGTQILERMSLSAAKVTDGNGVQRTLGKMQVVNV